MTCIIGYANNKNVWMVGDVAGVCSQCDYTAELKISKVFKKETPCGTAMLVGYTSTFRMGQVLEHVFTPPRIDNKDIFQYLCTDFVDTLRHTLKDKEIAENNSGVVSGGCFLVGVKGHLFSVESDFSVLERARPFNAVGGG